MWVTPVATAPSKATMVFSGQRYLLPRWATTAGEMAMGEKLATGPS